MKITLWRTARAGFLLAVFLGLSLSGYSQEKPQKPSKPINLDRALQTKKPEDRAQSYYYFSMAKWYEEQNDLARALTEMRKAREYNESSSDLRVELAGLLFKNHDVPEAEEECQESIRLDPKNPEAYWLLAYIYGVRRDKTPNQEPIRKAVEQLEKMREIAPQDDRSYFYLGQYYFEMGESDKAIQAYEKFQSIRPDTDVGYAAIGEYYQKQGDIDKAIQYFSKAVQAQPESLKSMMLLASLYTQANKDKDAIPLYKKILELSKDNLPVKRQLGSALVDTGQFKDAIKVLGDVVKATPNDSYALTQLGRACLGGNEIPNAIENLKAALKANSRNAEAEFYLGLAYEQSGNSPEAAKIFAQLIEKSKGAGGKVSEEQKKNSEIFQQHLAMAYQDMGENEKAIGILEDMVKEDPDPSPRHLFLLINAYRVNRQLDKALALGKQYYEKNPKDSSIGLVYARTLADVGKANQGADLVNKMIQADPGNLDLYMNLSQIYIQGKRYADAEKILQRAQEKGPDDERFKFQLASVYDRQKDFDRAESLFRQILQENPNNASALNYIGYMLADRGVRLEEAVEYVEKALALEPNNGAYLDSLGWAYFKLNKFDEAEKYLLKAVAAVKNDSTIHDHLGDLYFKNGDFEKAQDYWNKSYNLGTEQDERQKVHDKIDKLKDLLKKQKNK